jgi:hypothetical protein
LLSLLPSPGFKVVREARKETLGFTLTKRLGRDVATH